MSNLIDKIRSSQNPLIDRLRGLNPFKGELVFPKLSTDPLDEEVKTLKSKYSPDQVFEALKTKMPESEAHKRVYGFEPNPKFQPAMQQETEGLIKALKATPEAFNTPVTAATGLAEIASKKLGASDKLAQGVGLAAGLVLPVPGNKAQKLNKGIKLTEELLWSRKDKLDDVLKEVMPKLQKENPSVWMELSDPLNKIKSGKFTNEDLNQVDEILKLNKLGNYKPVPKENVVDLRRTGHISKKLAVGAGASAVGLSLITPLIVNKLNERDQKSFYEGIKKGIETAPNSEELFKISSNDIMDLVKDKDKQFELYELIQKKLDELDK